MYKLLAVLVAGSFATGAFAAQHTAAPVTVPTASVHAVKMTSKATKKKTHQVAHKAKSTKKM